jgi:hypothetical protein
MAPGMEAAYWRARGRFLPLSGMSDRGSARWKTGRPVVPSSAVGWVGVPAVLAATPQGPRRGVSALYASSPGQPVLRFATLPGGVVTRFPAALGRA